VAQAFQSLVFSSQKDWSAWLARNHDKSQGVWLRLAKKASSIPSVSHGEALGAALCYGWIDARKRSESETTWLEQFTPRATKSIWSKINREKAVALGKAGRMKPAGLAQIERAKKDGRWEAAYDSPSSATAPPELQAALYQNARAKDFYATLNSQNRYAILFRIQTAKKPETRAKRIQRFVEMLEKNEKLHP
jgi:uncharacterized protein YdeI (YjbR/CyaY-like superfamily)